MVLLGIAFFGGVLGSYRNLQLSVQKPYEEMSFADLTVGFGPAPQNITTSIASVDGVSRVSGRLTIELPSIPPGSSETFIGRVVTLPAPLHPSVNDVLVTAGTYLTTADSNRVLVEKAFAEHHGIKLDDTVSFILPTGMLDFTVAGLVISPEYLWPARTVYDHMPDVLRRWGVFFAPYASVSTALGLNNQINEVAVTLEKDADFQEVESALKSLLSAYGIISLTPREKQPSNLVTNMSVEALDTLSLVFPTFFLTIVALSTYVLLTRQVYLQKQQIGVLLALGVSRKSVLQHYMGFALLIGLGGSLAGSLGGYLLASPITDIFAERVSLPLVYKTVHWDIVFTGVLLALGFTLVAGLVPALRAARLMPAETMRGDSPQSTKWKKHRVLASAEQGESRSVQVPGLTAFAKLTIALQFAVIVFLSAWLFQEYRYNAYLQAYVKEFIETNGATVLWPALVFSAALVLAGLVRIRNSQNHSQSLQPVFSSSRLRPTTKLPFRSLGRNPVRTGFTILALALAASLIMVPLGFIDSMNSIVGINEKSAAYDLQATFYKPQQESIAVEVGNWPGVGDVEPFILLPTLLKRDGAVPLDIQAYGLRGTTDLHRLFVSENVRVYPARGEVLLSSVFERKGVQVGDTVQIGEIFLRARNFVQGFSNAGFLLLEDAQEALGLPGVVNAVVLRTSQGEELDSISTRLYSSYPVWSTVSTEKALQDTNEMLQLYYGFIDVIVLAGLIIAVAIVFNFVMINVLERGREIATMKTLGVGGRSISITITMENLLVLGAAAILGSLIGLFLTDYFVTLFQTDLFVLTSRINASTYMLSGVMLLGALLVSQVPAIRKVYRMDLAKTTKERVG